MFEQLQNLVDAVSPPTHANVGETYTLHQFLAAYYYLQAKCALYEHHSQSPALKQWWKDALAKTQSRTVELEAEADRLGVPHPRSLPVTTELTDEFMAIDGMAMIQGMLMADLIGLQASVQPRLAALEHDMLNNTLKFGARLRGLIETEGWAINPPAYLSAPGQ